MNRILPLLLLACAGAGGFAQQLPPAEADYFSDRAEEPREPGGGVVGKPAKANGFPHGLIFHRGGFLHGELVAVTKTEIVWLRPDVDEPIRIPRGEVRRLVLREFESRSRHEPMNFGRGDAETAPAGPAPATIKLTGSDWLHGDVRSADGQKFTLRLKNGPGLEFSRGAVDWFYFNEEAALAAAFSSNALALEPWRFSRSILHPPAEDGIFTLGKGDWVGRTIEPTSRVEVEWAVRAGSDADACLWFQPAEIPAPGSYSSGTVALSFNAAHLRRTTYVDAYKRVAIPWPKAEPGADGLTHYRVFYDARQSRLAVMRNGELVGDWELRAPAEAQPEAGEDSAREPRLPRCVFLEADLARPLELQRFRMRPWNGILPKPNAVAVAEDRMTTQKESALGKLEAVGPKDFRFGGVARPRSAGTLIEFARPAGATAKAEAFSGDALLCFGEEGELMASDLEISEGRFTCRSNAIGVIEGNVRQLQTLAFARAKAEADAAPSVLVFRNGDILPGTLLADGRGLAFRWRTAQGQELVLETPRIAGVRWPAPAEVKTDDSGVVVELRNGDRLHGDGATFSHGRCTLKNRWLGDLTLDRAQLWQLSASAKIVTPGPGSTVRPVAGADGREAPEEGNFLDGRRLQFGPTPKGGAVAHSFASPLERYELRVEAMADGGAEPDLSWCLRGEAKVVAQFRVSSGWASLLAFNLPAAMGKDGQPGERQIQREKQFSEKVPKDPRGFRAVRMFVDRKAGTLEVFVDGLPIVKAGQQADERMPGLGSSFEFEPNVRAGSMTVWANLWAGPWDGELPRAGEEASRLVLNNGDIAPGMLRELTTEKAIVEGDAGLLEIPLERVASFRFGGAPAPVKAAARVWLRDGSVVQLEEYRWKDGELWGRSAVVGEIKVPAAGVAELVLSPAPMHFPKGPAAGKLNEKGL